MIPLACFYMDKISGRMHKKLLEERFSLGNDLLAFIVCSVLRRGNRILDCEQLFCGGFYEKQLL